MIKKKYDGQIRALYERVAKSDDEQLRNRAIFMLASKYIGYGEYDKAQELLDSLPERTAMDKTQASGESFDQTKQAGRSCETSGT